MKNEPLWRVWWLWGVALGALAAGLLMAAEALRNASHAGWANFLDVMRLALYWAWLREAWACAVNVENPVWTPLSRAALVAVLIVNALA